jgi:hypothetical protein
VSRIHDGISCPLRPRPLGILLALGLAGAGLFLCSRGEYFGGGPLLAAAAVVLADQKGTQKVHVLHSKLFVENEWLVTGLLIGPGRDRVEWPRVKTIKVEGKALVCETDGAPFITGRTASADDLEHLRALAQKTFDKARAAGFPG